MSSSRKYELVYVLAPEMTEDAVTELHAQVEATVTRYNGQIEKSENWGRRKLAYEIGRHREGIYVLEVILGSGDLMKEIDRRLKVNEQVLRHMVVRTDEELKAAERSRARRQADADRRGVRTPPAGEAADEAVAPQDGTDGHETEA